MEFQNSAAEREEHKGGFANIGSVVTDLKESGSNTLLGTLHTELTQLRSKSSSASNSTCESAHNNRFYRDVKTAKYHPGGSLCF